MRSSCISRLRVCPVPSLTTEAHSRRRRVPKSSPRAHFVATPAASGNRVIASQGTNGQRRSRRCSCRARVRRDRQCPVARIASTAPRMSVSSAASAIVPWRSENPAATQKDSPIKARAARPQSSQSTYDATVSAGRSNTRPQRDRERTSSTGWHNTRPQCDRLKLAGNQITSQSRYSSVSVSAEARHSARPHLARCLCHPTLALRGRAASNPSPRSPRARCSAESHRYAERISTARARLHRGARLQTSSVRATVI
jgi:hypothetical protein